MEVCSLGSNDSGHMTKNRGRSLTRRRRLSNQRNCTGQLNVGFPREQRYKFSRHHTHRIPETKERVTWDAETHNNPLEELLAVINDENSESTGNQPRKHRSNASTGKPAREHETRGNTQPLQGKLSGS